MPVIVSRNPTSDEAVSGTWDGSAGTRYTVVNDHPDAGGSTSLTHGTTAGNLTFGFSAFSIPSIATDISVDVIYYDQKTGNGAAATAGRLKVGGNYYNSTTHNPTNGVWVLRTKSWATNPKTSVAWTVNDINGSGANALQAFGFFSDDANPTVKFASVIVQVTYTVLYNLTQSASGSYPYTGNASNLIASRKLIQSAAGGYAYTGNASTLLAQRLLTQSAAGEYPYTGFDSELTYTPGSGPTYTLTQSTSGEYAYTGFNTDLLRRGLLQGESGAYAYTGNPSVLTASRILAQSAAGSYAYTGNVSTLAALRVLTQTAAGQYAYTGNASELVALRLLTQTAAGEYPYAGFDTNLIFFPIGGINYTLTMDAPGEYAYTGGTSQMLRRVKLTQDASGAYAYTAENSTMLRSAVLGQSSPGVYTYRGFDVRLVYSEEPLTFTGEASAAVNTGGASAAINTGAAGAIISSGERAARAGSGSASASVNTGRTTADINTGDTE